MWRWHAATLEAAEARTTLSLLRHRLSQHPLLAQAAAATACFWTHVLTTGRPFASWTAYVAWRRRKRVWREAVRAHVALRLLPRTLRALRSHAVRAVRLRRCVDVGVARHLTALRRRCLRALQWVARLRRRLQLGLCKVHTTLKRRCLAALRTAAFRRRVSVQVGGLSR